MSLSKSTQNTITRLQRIAIDLKHLFSRRDHAIDLMTLALLCQEHVLLLGVPGTGKSELASRFADAIQASKFQYLLTRFTEPTEIFGPMNLSAFKEGRYEILTQGMLPAAQVVFLDEIFQSSSAILNTLLTLLNERLFFNGTVRQKAPLMTLFGASNSLPDDPTLRAFSDRFPLRIEVESVPDDSLGELFDKGWALEVGHMKDRGGETESLLKPEALQAVYKDLARVDATPVMATYLELTRRLRSEGIVMSDRRLIKGLKFIRGAAMLDGRDKVGNQDLWPLNHMWNSLEEARRVQETIQPLVDAAGGPSLRRVRPLADLLDELEDLEGRAPDSDSALTAHLAALAQIRREVMSHHVGENELIQRIQNAIQQSMEWLQSTTET